MKIGSDPNDTLGMMTAAFLEDASILIVESFFTSCFVMISAGVSNAVDAATAHQQADWKPTVMGRLIFGCLLKGNYQKRRMCKPL